MMGSAYFWACVFLMVSWSALSAQCSMHAFVPERKSIRGSTPRNVIMETLLPPESSSSLPLPPLPGSRCERTKLSLQELNRKKVRAEAYNRKWRGRPIPGRVPKLSDVLRQPQSSRKQSATPSPKVPRNSSLKEEQAGRTTKEVNGPWMAGYYTSLKSQSLIQDAATNPKLNLPIERATAVLETFLSIPSRKCNAANLVCALTLSAKVMGRESDDNFRSLLYRTNNILYQMLKEKYLSARQLCNAAWALAKHYDRDVSLLPAPPEAAALNEDTVVFGKAETWDLRNDIAGCPAQRVDETIDEIASQLTALLNEDIRCAKEGELCMASWAYGILRRRRRPPGWQHGPQLSKLPIQSSDKEQRVASHFVKFEQWGSDDHIANHDAVPKERDSDMPCVTGTLLDAIGHALCEPLEPDAHGDKSAHRRIRRCKWSELANVAWAFASHGRSCSHNAQTLLEAIASESSRRLNENGIDARQALSRDIAQIVWSLGTLQTDNFRLGDSLTQFVDAVAVYTPCWGANELRKWSCADIVQVVLSLAHARLDESPILHGLYTEALRRLDLTDEGGTPLDQGRKTFFTWELSVMLWAQARFYLNESEGKVFGAFARKAIIIIDVALRRGSSFTNIGIGPQEQANIAWSLTVLELYDTPVAVGLLGAIFGEAASSCRKEGVMQLEHAHQLWQALYLLEDECPLCVATVPEWFQRHLRDKWNLEKARPKISSARHLSLSKTLHLMGVAHINEHDEDIDVAIVLKPDASWTHETEKSCVQAGVRVAVEFDGPNHFTRHRLSPAGKAIQPPRALGHTVLKYRLLKKQGWTVVRVPYYEYDKIPFWASMERQRYLQRLLKTHGNLRFSQIDISEYKAQVPHRGSRFD